MQVLHSRAARVDRILHKLHKDVRGDYSTPLTLTMSNGVAIGAMWMHVGTFPGLPGPCRETGPRSLAKRFHPFGMVPHTDPVYQFWTTKTGALKP